jgi:hypothetical protein
MNTHKRSLIKIIPDKEKREIQLHHAKVLFFSQLLLALFVVESFQAAIFFINGSFLDLAEQFGCLRWVLLACFIVLVILSIGVSCIINLNLSHKLVGPLYRIEMVLRELIDGKEISSIHIRKEDNLHEFLELINKALKRVQNK